MGKKPISASEHRKRLSAWVKHHAAAQSLTDTAIAEALGVSQSSFNKLKHGNRTAKFEEAAILSQLFSAELPVDLELATQQPVRKLIGLRQNVAADVWRRKATLMVDAKLSVSQFPNEKYDNLEQFAYYVDDEHANGYVPRGFYVVCVDYFQARSALLHVDKVVVMRYRVYPQDDDGSLVETSIRCVARRGDGWVLESLSADRSLYADIPYSEDTPQLTIAGLIIARYAPD